MTIARLNKIYIYARTSSRISEQTLAAKFSFGTRVVCVCSIPVGPSASTCLPYQRHSETAATNSREAPLSLSLSFAPSFSSPPLDRPLRAADQLKPFPTIVASSHPLPTWLLFTPKPSAELLKLWPKWPSPVPSLERTTSDCLLLLQLSTMQIVNLLLRSYESLPPNFSLIQNMAAGAFAGIAVCRKQPDFDPM